MELKDKAQYSSSVNVCAKCRATRKGSLTAWVFGKSENVCQCYEGTGTAPPLPWERHLPITGDVIGGRYQIVETVGKGGMGTVYLVQHLFVNRTFALKMLRQELITCSSTLQRFFQEAKATSSLTHPNLVSVHDFGVTVEGVPYFVMEHVKGTSLADVLAAEGSLAPERVLDIFAQICAAVEHAHSRSVIHRDIKPSNILVTKKEDGSELVKLVDFGIAKILAEDGSAASANITQTGNLLGSPLYMSPEQCGGENSDKRGDIYSIGCVMYEALIGEPPFIGPNSMHILLQHIKGSTVELRDRLIECNIPVGLESIVLRCLEKLAEDRYQSAESLRQDIEQTKKGQAISHAQRRNRFTWRRVIVLIKLATQRRALAASFTVLILAALTIAALALLAVREQAPTVVPWRQLDIEGQDHFNNGDLSTARKVFAKALIAAPNEASDQRLVLSSLEELLDVNRAEGNLPETTRISKEIIILKLNQEKNAATIETEIRSELAQPVSKDHQRLVNLFNNANDVAASLIETGHFEKASVILKLGKQLCERTLGTECEVMTRFLHNLAYNLHSQGKYFESLEQYRQALTLERQEFKNKPNFLEAVTLLEYGRLCLQIGQESSNIEAIFQRSLEIDKVLFGPQSKQIASVRFHLAALYFHEGRNDEAKQELNTALAIYNSLEEPIPDKEARCYELLGLITKDTNSLKKALSLYQSATNKNYPFLLETLEGIARQTKNDHPKEAIPLIRRALVLSERLGERDRGMEQAKLYEVLGELYRRLNDLPNAERSWSQALRMRVTLFGENSWQTFETLSDLAILNIDLVQPAKTEAFFERCFKILSVRQDPDKSPEFISKTLFWYAQFHKSDGKARIQAAVPPKWRQLLPK